MDNQYSSFYLYRKYEVVGDELIDLGITSIDAEGTLEPVMKEECDPECGCPPPEPIYRWVQTEDTVCVGEEPANPKFILTLSDSSTVSAECDSTSSITYNEVSVNYSNTLVSAEIGDCVTNISNYSFFNCSSLTSVTIPNSVTSIETAFISCSGLTNIDIPNSVISIGGYAFEQCTSLSSCTIGSGVTSIGDRAFYYCTGLTSIDIPNSVISIGGYAFASCSDLTSITVNAVVPPTLGNYAFDNTNNCPIYVPCESVEAYKAATGWSVYASRIEGIPPCGQPTPTIDGKYKLTLNDSSTVSAECDTTSAVTSGEVSSQYSGTVVSAEIGNCTTSIGNRAFYQCTSLTSCTIGSSVTSIGSGAFNDCSGLTNITIPDSVTSIGGSAFWRCTSLTSCTIGSSVTSIGTSTFYQCSGLTSIDIPSSVTSIRQQAFSNCRSLTSITVNATTPPTLGNNAFYNTSSSLVIYVPATSVNTYKSTSGWTDYASRIQAIP